MMQCMPMPSQFWTTALLTLLVLYNFKRLYARAFMRDGPLWDSGSD